MIKRELVLNLYKKQKISKAKIAIKLGITKGSVTQYVQGKRAANSGKLRKVKEIDKMVNNLSEDLANKKLKDKQVSQRFCALCKMAQKKTGVC